MAHLQPLDAGDLVVRHRQPPQAAQGAAVTDSLGQGEGANLLSPNPPPIPPPRGARGDEVDVWRRCSIRRRPMRDRLRDTMVARATPAAPGAASGRGLAVLWGGAGVGLRVAEGPSNPRANRCLSVLAGQNTAQCGKAGPVVGSMATMPVDQTQRPAQAGKSQLARERISSQQKAQPKLRFSDLSSAEAKKKKVFWGRKRRPNFFFFVHFRRLVCLSERFDCSTHIENSKKIGLVHSVSRSPQKARLL